MDTGTDTGHIAREAVRTAITKIVIATDGKEAFTEQPIFKGASSTEPVPEPRAALRAAQIMRDAAEHAVNRSAQAMRSDGYTWTDVARVVTNDPDAGGQGAEETFERFAWRSSFAFDPLRFSWRCGSCDQFVTDSGPYNGHPVDCEQGHAENCQRHAAEIRRYEQWIEDHE